MLHHHDDDHPDIDVWEDMMARWFSFRRRKLTSVIRDTTSLTAFPYNVQDHYGENSMIEPSPGLVFQPVLDADVVFTAAWAIDGDHNIELLWLTEVEPSPHRRFEPVSPLDLRPNNAWYLTVDEDELEILFITMGMRFFRSDAGQAFMENYCDSDPGSWDVMELVEIYDEIRHSSEANAWIYEISYDEALAWAVEADLL